MCTSRRQPVRLAIAVPSFSFWPPLRLKTPRFRWFPTGILRNWNPRPACGTAIKSVRISMSVFGFVPTRDEPAECLPWTRRTGVRRYLPCPEMYVSTADSSWLMPQELQFCLIFGIPSWLMPLRDRSGQRWQPSGKPYVVAATKVCSRLIGVCRELSPPLLPLPFPFLSLLSGVFLNGILRSSPLFPWCVPGRSFVAGNTFLSLLSLSLPLSFFPSLFPLFSLFLGCPWMLSS